jgi:predicted heme/steroid binding protein
VVPERELTLKELAQHDGSDPDKPLLLAISGTVFDITPGAFASPVTGLGNRASVDNLYRVLTAQ